MLGKFAVLALSAFVATNAVQLEKCKPKGEPVFVDENGLIEIELDGSDPATWGPAE